MDIASWSCISTSATYSAIINLMVIIYKTNMLYLAWPDTSMDVDASLLLPVDSVYLLAGASL